MGRKEFYEKMKELRRIRQSLTDSNINRKNRQQLFQIKNQIEQLKLLQ